MPLEHIAYQSYPPPRNPRRRLPIRSILLYLLLFTPTLWALTRSDLVVFSIPHLGTAPNEAGMVRSTI